ncbi:hypothetical protein, partial [Pseudomonas gingeri]|uniref:hypothetical protein n=1 Tax=Pseudomonas gingeri TaxID=117681 RepID=UPI001ADED419
RAVLFMVNHFNNPVTYQSPATLLPKNAQRCYERTHPVRFRLHTLERQRFVGIQAAVSGRRHPHTFEHGLFG